MYAIILDKPNETAWDNVRQIWPRHYIADERVAYVVSENELTAAVAEKAGIKADGLNGVVIQMDYFSGFSSSALAEWVSKSNE